MMDNEEKLAAVKRELEERSNMPLLESNLVFGEGNSSAEIVFIGEAPGFYEDKEKRPFVGRAGKLLNRLISDIGMKRGEVYITNIVKRRPPGNRDPFPEEIESYRPYLKEEIEIIDPKIIATLGRFSMSYFLPEGKISRDQGKIFWWGKRIVMPLYHPAAALRSTSVLKELEDSFKKLNAVKKKFDELVSEREKTNEARKSSSAKATENKEEQAPLF